MLTQFYCNILIFDVFLSVMSCIEMTKTGTAANPSADGMAVLEEGNP